MVIFYRLQISLNKTICDTKWLNRSRIYTVISFGFSTVKCLIYLNKYKPLERNNNNAFPALFGFQ